MGAALAGIGGSLLGSVVSGIFGKKEAVRQENFQREMSNTAYQRQVADMKAAGINPMVGYSSGGASTPTGAQATVPDYSTVGDAINSNVRMASIEKKRLDMDKQMNDALISKIDEEKKNLVANRANAIATLESTNLSNKMSARANAVDALQFQAQKARASVESKASPYTSVIDAILDRLPLVHGGLKMLSPNK